MIQFHWSYLLVTISMLALGVFVGIVTHLPLDQASNFVYFLAGFTIGLVGIFIPLWVAAEDRKLRLGEIHATINETNQHVQTLASLASQMWAPAMQALLARELQRGVGAVQSATEAAQRGY